MLRLFTKIKTREDALKAVKDTSIVVFVLAGFCALFALDEVNARALLLGYAVLLAGLGLILLKKKSRTAAVILLLLVGLPVLRILLLGVLDVVESWDAHALALVAGASLIFLLSISWFVRAVAATFKLHGKFAEQMEVKYFRLYDSDTLIACVDPAGLEAMFRLGAGDREWDFLVPDSPRWDSIHQEIYRDIGHRADSVAPGDLPPDLPPLPEIPKGPFPKKEDYALTKVPIHAPTYPYVTEFLKARKDEAATVFVVLLEDTYESHFGDGTFHYFEDAFLTREDAQRYIERCPSEWDQTQRQWYRLHLRTMSIALLNEKIVFPDFKLELFDHYAPLKVLQVLELRLPHKASWVCDFDCDRPIEDMLRVFNEAGPWQWWLCDPGSSIEEDNLVMRNYIETWPSQDIRVRVDGSPWRAAWHKGRTPSKTQCTALLEIKANSSATQAEIDGIFRGLLARIDATNITESKPIA